MYDTILAAHTVLHPRSGDAVEPPSEPTEWELWGLAVRSARKGAGLTQRELADRFDLNQSYVSLIERGLRHSVRPALLRAIAASYVSTILPRPIQNLSWPKPFYNHS